MPPTETVPNDVSTTQEKALNKSVLVSYSTVSLPLAALGLPLAIYLPPFFAQDLGLGLATVGLIFTLARVWDVVTDPSVGYLMDRFPSRWGRRRHWMFIGVPITVLGGFLIYMPPATVSPFYLVVWLFVLYLGMTISSVTHQAWGSDLTTSYNERSRIFGWREIWLSFGMLLVLVLPAIAEQLWQVDTRTKVASMGWFLVISLPLTVLLAAKVVPDRTTTVSVHTSWADVRTILNSNPAYLRCLAGVFLTFLSASATSGLLLFVLEWVYELKDESSALLLLFFLPAMAGAPLWMHLSYRLSKPKALLIALIYICVCQVMLLLVPRENTLLPLSILFVFMGLGVTATPILLRALLADATDLDALNNGGKYRTGLMFACFTTGEKLAGAIAIGSTYLALDLIGFDSTTTTNSTESIQGLLYIVIFLPLAANLLAMLLCLRFPITPEQHAETVTELQRIGALDEHPTS